MVVRVFYTRLGDISDNSERSVFCWLEAIAGCSLHGTGVLTF